MTRMWTNGNAAHGSKSGKSTNSPSAGAAPPYSHRVRFALHSFQLELFHAVADLVTANLSRQRTIDDSAQFQTRDRRETLGHGQRGACAQLIERRRSGFERSPNSNF